MFSTQVEAILREIGKDLQLGERLKAYSFDLDEQDSSTAGKTFLKWGGTTLGVAATILAFIPGGQPFAIALAIAAAAFGIISSLTNDLENREAPQGGCRDHQRDTKSTI